MYVQSLPALDQWSKKTKDKGEQHARPVLEKPLDWLEMGGRMQQGKSDPKRGLGGTVLKNRCLSRNPSFQGGGDLKGQWECDPINQQLKTNPASLE